MVIGHTDCGGVQGMDGGKLLEELTHRGISQEHIDIIRSSGINLEKWLGGFDCVEQSVKDTILALQKHPLMPKDIMIRGFCHGFRDRRTDKSFRGVAVLSFLISEAVLYC